jgi:DNA-binding XRE family transcriptional regulator
MITSDRQLAIKQRDLNKWQQLKKRTMEMAQKFELKDDELLLVFENRISDLSKQCQDYRGIRVVGSPQDPNDRSWEAFEALTQCANLGQMLIKARIELGWSQAALAEAVGLQRQNLWRYEKSMYSKINLATAVKIAAVLLHGLSARRSQLERHR